MPSQEERREIPPQDDEPCCFCCLMTIFGLTCLGIYFMILGIRAENTGCSLCRDDGPMRFPSRIVPNTGDLTCLQLEEAVLSNVAKLQCDDVRDNVSNKISMIDLFAYCGCEGTTIPKTCSVCEANPVASLSSDANVQTKMEDVSCTELTTAIDYLVDQDYCQGIEIFSNSCCGVGTNGDIDNGPRPCSLCDDVGMQLIHPDFEVPSHKGVTCSQARNIASLFASESDACQTDFDVIGHGCCKASGRCSICSEDHTVTMLYPNRMLPFAADGATCIGVEYFMGSFSKDQCQDFQEATAPLDFGAWCGCEGAIWEGSDCSLCADGLEVQRDRRVPDAPLGITCGLLADWAPYVDDAIFCDTRVSLLSGECCVDSKGQRAKAPTLAPRFRPSPHGTSNIPKSTAIRHVQFVITAIVGVLGMMIE